VRVAHMGILTRLTRRAGRMVAGAGKWVQKNPKKSMGIAAGGYAIHKLLKRGSSNVQTGPNNPPHGF